LGWSQTFPGWHQGTDMEQQWVPSSEGKGDLRTLCPTELPWDVNTANMRISGHKKARKI
jgi:hypothetical protein